MKKPIFTPSLYRQILARDLKQLNGLPPSFPLPLHSERVNLPTKMPSPTSPRAWVLVSETGRGVYLKSQPRGKCCYSHCTCEIFAQLRASRSLSTELRSRHKDHKGKLKDEWKSVTRPPLMTSLLPRWH